MSASEQARSLYERWHEVRSTGEIDLLLGLYSPGATFESPLVPVLMRRESGVCHAQDEMRAFFTEGVRRRPDELVRWYRDGTHFFDGATLIWEYPRETPAGDQLDIIEVMEISDGSIVRHRLYWGFVGVNELRRSDAAARSGINWR